MALKLLLGSLGLAVGVAVTVATGGSVLPVLGMVVGGTIATGLFGAGMYTASSAATGDWSLDGCLKAAGDSMLDGYMWSGLTAAAGSLYGWYKSGSTTAKYVGDDYCVGKGGSDTTRVGRWMSEDEYNKMLESGFVQKTYNADQSYVANPADYYAFHKQAKNGTVYVEFDVPSSSLKQTKDIWATIPGPNSMYSKLIVKKGLSPYNFARAKNIKLVGKK